MIFMLSKISQKLDRLFTGREKVEPWGVQSPWDMIIDSSYAETNHTSMMFKLAQVLKSRTFWTLVVMFIINGITGIREHINPGWLTTIDAILGIVATYLHVNPSQNYHE